MNLIFIAAAKVLTKKHYKSFKTSSIRGFNKLQVKKQIIMGMLSFLFHQ